jgi:hypothetical protein
MALTIDGSSITFTDNTTLTSANVNLVGLASIKSVREQVLILSAAAIGNINFDANNQGILMTTLSSTGNWNLNVRATSSVALSSALQVGDSFTIKHIAPQGTIAYIPSSLSIDNVNTNQIFWNKNITGNPNSVDVYVYQIIKTKPSTYKVLASQTNYSSPSYTISF